MKDRLKMKNIRIPRKTVKPSQKAKKIWRVTENKRILKALRKLEKYEETRQVPKTRSKSTLNVPEIDEVIALGNFVSGFAFKKMFRGNVIEQTKKDRSNSNEESAAHNSTKA